MVLRFNRATVCFVTCGSSHCNHKGCKIKVRSGCSPKARVVLAWTLELSLMHVKTRLYHGLYLSRR